MINIESNTIEIKQMQQKMQHYFQTHWKLFLAEGIFLIILGIIADSSTSFFYRRHCRLFRLDSFVWRDISYHPGLAFFPYARFWLVAIYGNFTACHRLFVSCTAA